MSWSTHTAPATSQTLFPSPAVFVQRRSVCCEHLDYTCFGEMRQNNVFPFPVLACGGHVQSVLSVATGSNSKFLVDALSLLVHIFFACRLWSPRRLLTETVKSRVHPSCVGLFVPLVAFPPSCSRRRCWLPCP